MSTAAMSQEPTLPTIQLRLMRGEGMKRGNEEEVGVDMGTSGTSR